MSFENAADLQIPGTEPCAGPAPSLEELIPVYRPLSQTHFPPYTLVRDDVDLAFDGSEGGDWTAHRARRMDLVCAPLEQLMSLGDDISGTGTADRVVRAHRDGRRVESCQVALHPASDRRDIRAIARFERQCAVGDGQLDIAYMLNRVSVLPAHRDTGMDRLLATGVASLMVRELDDLAVALWHALALTVEVRFCSQVDQPVPRVLDRIIASRLCDELIAQDSLLQLDGKLSRFQPLTVEQSRQGC